MKIEEIQDEIVEEFSMFDDWMQRYEYMIELGKSLPLIEEQYKTEDNVIKGCQSKVWLHASFENGKIYFSADSDAIITKGLVGMITGIFSGHSPKEIAETNLHFINDIGLTQHLSPNRSNGLLSMIKQIKYYALAFQAKM